MSLKCAACHRPLKKAAKQHGKAAYGPVCAARYFGKLLGGVRQAPERDDKTQDLFDNEKNETPLREQRGSSHQQRKDQCDDK